MAKTLRMFLHPVIWPVGPVGLSNGQIARELVVSQSTVKTHVNHLLSKTGCRDRAALVAWAYAHDLTGD